MGDCELCAGDDKISYTCNECGGTFCSNHRLPEDHRCEALLSKNGKGWFKEDLSVRKNRRQTQIQRNSPTSESDKEAPSSKNGATTGPGMTCSECDRAARANCGECGDPYCEEHRESAAHDCTPVSHGKQASVTDEGREEQDAPAVDLPDCVKCGRDAWFECDGCDQDFCLRHRRQANHECTPTQNPSGESGILRRVKNALFGD